jgi:hypothetical protein
MVRGRRTRPPLNPRLGAPHRHDDSRRPGKFAHPQIRMMFEELGFEPEAFRKKYAAELEEGLSLPRTQSGVTRHAAYATGPIHVTPDWVFGTHNQ